METIKSSTTVMGPNYSYVFDFERDFEHEVTKGWFLVSESARMTGRRVLEHARTGIPNCCLFLNDLHK